MRKLLLVAAVALVCSSMALATNTDELELVSSGATTIVVLDTGSTPPDTITYSNLNFNGWDIIVTTGISTSPVTDAPAIDLTSLTATCNALGAKGCATNPLEVLYSDTGFATALNGLTSTYSGTVTGGGSTSEIAYVDSTNTIFGEGTTIGTVGPITSPFGGGNAALSGSWGPSPYSLTLEQIFNANGGKASFSVDGNLSAVPEPTSIVLFGTILSLGGFAFRRKLKKNS